MYAYMWEYAPECWYLWKPEASDPLELELQAAVIYLVWILGVELGSSGRATGAVSLAHTGEPAHHSFLQ